MAEPVQADLVVTKDETSGRFHKRLKFEGRMFVDERCNLDDAGSYIELPSVSRAIDGRGVPVGTHDDMLCKNCFPGSEGETI